MSHYLKISKQTREAYLKFNTLPIEDQASVVMGEWDGTTGMQALEAFRSETKNAALDEASKAVVGYIHPDYPRLPGEPFASTAIEALKEPANEHP